MAEGRTWRTKHLVWVGVGSLILGAGIGAAGQSSSSTKTVSAGQSTTTLAAAPTTTPEVTTAAPATTTSTRPTTTLAATTVPTKTTYALGDTATTGDFAITVYGYKDPQPPPGQFFRPQSGNHYVSVDVQVANKGSQQKSFSSVFGFHLVDGANRQYDEAIVTGVTPAQPDGEIPAGGAVRGFAVFEIPDGSTGLRLRVQGSLTASGVFFALA